MAQLTSKLAALLSTASAKVKWLKSNSNSKAHIISFVTNLKRNSYSKSSKWAHSDHLKKCKQLVKDHIDNDWKRLALQLQTKCQEKWRTQDQSTPGTKYSMHIQHVYYGTAYNFSLCYYFVLWSPCMTDRRLKITSNYPVSKFSNLPTRSILSLLRQWTSSNEFFSSNHRPTSSEQATISATFFFFFCVQLQYVEKPDIMWAYLLYEGASVGIHWRTDKGKWRKERTGVGSFYDTKHVHAS